MKKLISSITAIALLSLCVSCNNLNDKNNMRQQRANEIKSNIEMACVDIYPDDQIAQDRCKIIVVYYAEGKDANGIPNFPPPDDGLSYNEHLQQAITQGRPLWLLYVVADERGIEVEMAKDYLMDMLLNDSLTILRENPPKSSTFHAF